MLSLRTLGSRWANAKRQIWMQFRTAGTRRAPRRPVQLGLSPMLSLVVDYADGLRAYQTVPDVWNSVTFADAWRKMNEVLENSIEDESTLDRVHRMDMHALAKACARAELDYLLRCLPAAIRDSILKHPSFDRDSVEELFVHVSQPIEVRAEDWTFSLPPPTLEDVLTVASRVGSISSDGRGSISGTLHRVSIFVSRTGSKLGFTLRVGKYVPNISTALLPVAERGSVLLLSKPGVGKTTVLRDMAARLSRLKSRPRVIIVDTSNEIGGDGDFPLPYLHRARRLQVPQRADQPRIMTQALANHSPDYVIIDEIATEEEAVHVWSMTQRGIKLVATAHGETLSKLIQNRALNILVGGSAQAFLSNEERRLRSKHKKTILERPYNSPFDFVVELTNRSQARLYSRVNEAVDAVLDDVDPRVDRSLCHPITLSDELDYDALPGASRFGALHQSPLKRDIDGYTIVPSDAATGAIKQSGYNSNAIGAAAAAVNWSLKNHRAKPKKSPAREVLRDLLQDALDTEAPE